MKRIYLTCLCFFIGINFMNAQTLDTKHSYFYRNSDGSTIHYLFSTATKGKELIQRDNVLIAQQTSYSYYDKRTRKHYNSYGGGYYFGVRGTCETNFTYSYDGNIILIHLQGNSQTKVEAYIHPKSSENLSEHGGYKDNIMRQWKQDLPRNPDVNRCKSYMKDVLEYDKRSNKDILAYKIDDNRKLKQVNILSYNTCLEECDSIINSYIKTNNIEPSLHLIYSHLDSKVNDNWMFLKEDRQKLDTYFKEKIERLRTERENTELLEDIKNKIILFLDGSIEKNNVTPTIDETIYYYGSLKKRTGEDLENWMLDELKQFSLEQILETENKRVVLERERYNTLFFEGYKTILDTYSSTGSVPTMKFIEEILNSSIKEDPRFTTSSTLSDLLSNMEYIVAYFDIFHYIDQFIYKNNITPTQKDIFTQFDSVLKDNSEVEVVTEILDTIMPLFEERRKVKEEECFLSMQSELKVYLERLSDRPYSLPDDKTIIEKVEYIISQKDAYVRPDAEEVLKSEALSFVSMLRKEAEQYIHVYNSLSRAFNQLHQTTTAWDVKIFGADICISTEVEMYKEKWSDYEIPVSSSTFATTLAQYAPLHSFDIIKITEVTISPDNENFIYKAHCRFNLRRKQNQPYRSIVDDIYLNSNLKILYFESFLQNSPIETENEFDQIAELKLNIESKDIDIKNKCKKVHNDIYKSYTKFFKSCDWRINYDLPQNTVDNLTAILHTQNAMDEFIELRDSVSKNNTIILSVKKHAPDVVKAYSDYMANTSIAWELPQETSKLEDVIKTQSQVLIHINKRQTINELNQSIKVLSPKGKYIYKLYTTYFQQVDLMWRTNQDTLNLDECISTARRVIEVLNKDDVKSINNTARNQKITSLQDFLNNTYIK